MKMIKKYGKALIVLVVAIAITALTIWAALSRAEPIDSYTTGWELIRETANEDGANFAAVYNLAGNEGNFANKDSSSVANGGPYQIRSTVGATFGDRRSPGQKWLFAMCAEARNGADDTFSFNLVGWSRDNGMLQNICEGDAVLGTQSVVVYPDSGSAMGTSFTSVTYDHTGGAASKLFTKTDIGVGIVAGMMAYVTGTNITSGHYAVSSVVDDDNIAIDVTATNDTTDATVDLPVSYWCDTINLDETTKWQAAGIDPNTVYVFNSGDNEVANLVVDLQGIEWIQFVVYDADGATNEEAGNITVYGRKY